MVDLGVIELVKVSSVDGEFESLYDSDSEFLLFQASIGTGNASPTSLLFSLSKLSIAGGAKKMFVNGRKITTKEMGFTL
ncbi:hypothetical protein ACFX19_042495 [Malus domestica]